MRQKVFVISDLHLGGAPGDASSPGYQICSAAGRRRLADFVDWARRQRTPDCDVRLVLNGDVVDFLCESPFAAFTAESAEATRKLESIFRSTAEVWDAFARYVASGAEIVLLLGNHDIELSLAGPRRALLERLGPGRVDFLRDDEPLEIGPVLIEHGNRYDPLNSVPSGALRDVRSAVSRGEPPAFPPVPGSELVVRVVNDLKGRYEFINLLKPDAAALALLAVLEPGSLDLLPHVVDLYLTSRGRRARAHAPSAGPAGGTGLDADRALELLTLAREIARDDGERAVQAVGALAGFVEVWRLARAREERAEHVRLLFGVLRMLADSHLLRFLVNDEVDTYRLPAERSARDGFRVIVYGHSHFVKRVRLGGGALYLNTGTWADLVRLPEEVLGEAEDAGRIALAEFVEGVAGNDLSRWREQIPTFAKLEFGESELREADVFLFGGAECTPPVADGALGRFLV